MSAKYKSREESLKNKINDELSHKQPNVENIIKAINEFEQANIDTIAKLNRVKKIDDNKIRGALKQTINAHGPITMEFISSATKRINGTLLECDTFQNSPIKVKKEKWSIKSILVATIVNVIAFITIYFLFIR